MTCDTEAEAVFRFLMEVEAKIKNSIEAEVEAEKVEAEALKASTSIYIQWSFNRAHPLIRQWEYFKMMQYDRPLERIRGLLISL